jgi:hypothetical protein
LLALARSLPQHKRILIKSSISTAQLLCVCLYKRSSSCRLRAADSGNGAAGD